ncbi:MAG: dicarboxylate/amino acid:cation symporter [Gemmatimonadetes bacterium]|nr:dicarboxylate/amino acid:cation symporter [Gemmatimonadota bacterium]
MSLTTRVLIGLVAGFLIGLALAGASPSVSAPINAFLAPVGTIFVNLIRMTVIPLVASMLIASAGRMGASGALGRVGARAMAIAIALLAVATAVSVAVAIPVLDRVQIDQAAAMALRGPVADAAGSSPTLAQWFTDLVPLNVIKAAADGTMLPVILFAVLFGLALARVAEPRREAALGAIQGIADAMQRLVAWILDLAPIGVFALAVPLASELGLGAAGAVIVYIVLVVSLTVAVAIVLLYPIGIVAGRISPAAFIAFCTPAQAVAFASRSSIAALPAMIESAERARMPPLVSGFVLPLAASVFRVGGAVAMTVGALFLARLYGVALSPSQLATMSVTIVLSTFTVPGIPFGSIIAMVPVLASVGLPVEGIGILLAADTIPDMFRTTANATGMLTLAAALNRDNRLEPADAARRQ